MPKRRKVPDLLRHCVNAVAPRFGGDVRRAFAVCTSSLQRGGYLAPGTHKLTPRGKGKETAHRHEPGARGKLSRYEGMLATARGNPSPWAFAQYDDPEGRGSYGVSVRAPDAPHGVTDAVVYAFDGQRWHEVAKGFWWSRRGRLDVHLATFPQDIASGLAVALLTGGAARATLEGVTADPTQWAPSGRGLPPDVWEHVEANAAFHALASAKCEERQAARAKTSSAWKKANERFEGSRSIVRTVTRALCGRGDPVGIRTACDEYLTALEQSGDIECPTSAIPCPRGLTEATVQAWRRGEEPMPPLGPYETPRAHAMGADPCCLYHPTTQERLALHRAVEEQIARERPRDGVMESELYRRFAEAERGHALADAWAACDAAVRKAVGATVATARRHATGSEGIKLFVDYYQAHRDGDEAVADALWRELIAEGYRLDPGGSADRCGADFWDAAHLAAHDSGNNAWVTWAHREMKRCGVTVRHAGRR